MSKSKNKKFDPFRPSPHILNLRTRRHVQRTLAVTSTRFSRWIGWWEKKKEERSPFTLPSFPTFRSHDFRSLDHERRTGEWQRVLEHPFFQNYSLGLLLRLLCALVPSVFSFFLSFRGAPQRILRLCTGNGRYAWRRLRLLWEYWREEGEEKKEETGEEREELSFAPRRVVVAFVLTALIIALPLQVFSFYRALPSEEEVLREGKTIFSHLETALGATLEGSWENAETAWEDVARRNQEFGDRLSVTNPILGGIGSVVSARVRTARSLIFGMQEFARFGGALAAIGTRLSEDDAPLSRRLRDVPALLENALQSLESFAAHSATIDVAALPEELRASFQQNQQLLPSAITLFRRLEAMAAVLPTLLGDERPMRYLVLFQNDAELRPTGGFIGTIGILDVAEGAITKLFIPEQGSYVLQGALPVNLRSPVPLQHVNPRWEFHDANWWADFPTSAEKLLWFWEKAGQPTVDGVLALNSSLFERLLPLVGPIALPSYGKTIDAENFFLETEKAVELEYDRTENTPKKFLRDIADAVLGRIAEQKGDVAFPALMTFLEGLEQKDLQVFLRDPSLQRAIVRAGVAGTLVLPRPFEDVLTLVSTNIGGEKTDRVVRDTIVHEATIENDGSVVDSVTINRVHRGDPGAVFVGGRSRSYLRVSVPRGAALLAAEGFSLPTRRREIPEETYTTDPDVAVLETTPTDQETRLATFEELGRTVFGGWVELNPGEVKTVRLQYRLPFRLPREPRLTYQLTLEKQSGLRGATMEHVTHVPQGWERVEERALELRGPQPFLRDREILETFQWHSNDEK